VARPNILWIYCDELRTDALGCYGNPRTTIETPAIDSLASNGVVFENCYVNSPVCVPSRTSTLTGLSPERTGVYGNEAVWPRFPMSVRATFPEVLADAGYVTASFGKEHLPQVLQPWQHHDPTGAGKLDILRAVEDRSELRLISRSTTGVIGGTFPAFRRFPPTAVVDNLLSWVASARRPFFGRASILQPHTPVIPPAAFADIYADRPWPRRPVFEEGLSTFEHHFGVVGWADGMTEADFTRAQACYYGMVAWIDGEVGRLLDGLRDIGADRDLVIVLTSDHGCYLGENGAFGKHTFAPAVHRVPFIVSWPEMVDAERRPDLVQGLDLARTMLGFAGEVAPDVFEGRDVFSEDAPAQVFSTIGFGERQSLAYPNIRVGRWIDGRGWPRRSCVRTSHYRLDRNVRISGNAAQPSDWDVFLADSRRDPAETTNRAEDPQCRPMRDELLAAIDLHLRDSVEAPAKVVYPADLWSRIRRLRANLLHPPGGEGEGV
jgi:arylsulfatase A-like enzyme